MNTPPQAAQQLADVFQQSNANVEWRNGDLWFFGRKACAMFATVLTSVEISPAPSVRHDKPWASPLGHKVANAVTQ